MGSEILDSGGLYMSKWGGRDVLNWVGVGDKGV